MTILLSGLGGLLLGAALAWLLLMSRYEARLAATTTERDLLRAQSIRQHDELAAARALGERARDEAEEARELLARQTRARERDDEAAALALAPLAEAMKRVERQVGVLERDRIEQYGQLAEQLREVTAQGVALRGETARLAGALNASSVRGAWGEAQLRRVVEHAGMLRQVDFDEQVCAVTDHDAKVRPDAIVRLPGERVLVIDAKAPLSEFLAAQADGLTEDDRLGHLRAHASALRGHVDTLAAKRYWSAFPTTPEMVVCFVPTDAMLAAALQVDPGLYDAAAARKVVLTSPAVLLAMLHSVAFAWRQDALATNARELLALGDELYERLGTLGGQLTKMGASLRRSVEGYNALVGTLESRVFVTARRMHTLGLSHAAPPETRALEVSPRPLTAAELLDGEFAALPTRPELVLDDDRRPDAELQRRTGS